MIQFSKSTSADEKLPSAHLVHLGVVDGEWLFVQGLEDGHRLTIGASNEVGAPSARGRQLGSMPIL